MILQASDFSKVYQALKADRYLSEDKIVLLLVAHHDVDALCASEQFSVSAQADNLHVQARTHAHALSTLSHSLSHTHTHTG